MTIKYEDYKQYLAPVLYKSTDLVVKSGKGCYLTTVDGDEYLDFVQGIAVNALGHSHPKVIEAAKAQIDDIVTGSFNLVNYESTLKLSERIAKAAPGDLGVTFFSNGGAEANDGAIKLAKAASGRPGVIAFKGSFHGRTIGATAVTGSSAKYRKNYEPMMPSVYFTSFPYCYRCPYEKKCETCSLECMRELNEIFDNLITPDSVAAIMMEPVMGEGGYIVPPKKYMQKIREICDANGIYLIFDEIQTGFGRTGKMFGSENYDVVPDIMTIGKAIAGGFPMSAIVSKKEIMDKWPVGTHGTTFGGHPVCAAAANAVLDVFESDNIIAGVVEMGKYLVGRLEDMKKKYPVIGDVRGLGMMVAVELINSDGSVNPAAKDAVIKYCRENKVLFNGCGKSNVRFCTPLNITKEDLDKGLKVFEDSLKAL